MGAGAARQSGSYIKRHLPHIIISTRSRNTLQLAKKSKSGGARGSSTGSRVGRRERGLLEAPGRGRRGSGLGRLPAGAAGGRAQGPRGAPRCSTASQDAVLSRSRPLRLPPAANAPPGRRSGLACTRRSTGSLEFSSWERGAAGTGGVRASLPPPRSPGPPIPSAAGSQGLTILLGGSAARSQEKECRRSDGLPQEAAAAAALGTPAGRGCAWGRGGGAAGPAPAG